MDKPIVEEVPSGLSEAAQRERERFVDSFQRHLRAITSIALSILVWGPSPQSSSRVARKREQIRDALKELGHNAMFSEEWSAYGQGFSEKFKEFAQAKAAHLIIALPEDSPGALGEVHDFCTHPEIAPKIFVMLPKKYRDGYSGQGVIQNLENSHRGVYWYDDDEIDSCNVKRQALIRVQALREQHAMFKVQEP